jgi:hypothetical protein
VRLTRALALAALICMLVVGLAAGRTRLPAAAPTPKAGPAQVEAYLELSKTNELRALKAFDAGDVAGSRGALTDALADLKRADARGLAGYGDVVHDTKQAMLMDENALAALAKKNEAAYVRLRLNTALIRKEAALEAVAVHVAAPLPPAVPPPAEPPPPPSPPQPTPPAPAPPPPPETAPKSVLDGLAALDAHLARVQDDWRHGRLSEEQVVREVNRLEREKLQLLELFPPVYGARFVDLYQLLEGLDTFLRSAIEDTYDQDTGERNPIRVDFSDAIAWKQKLEQLLRPSAQPQPVTIEEEDTWTHNATLGKSNVCIDVRTTPPQASVSATLTGPGGYHAELPKSPLHTDGFAQIGSEITQAGDYTKTVTVYDAAGNVTASVTRTFTVLAPPQNGPSATPPCPAPTH